ncbi:MAG: hypothetical protein IM665_04720 [Phenylobacterium sp.]|nr:hypothetical protein [Phenylobacterium sp.]
MAARGRSGPELAARLEALAAFLDRLEAEAAASAVPTRPTASGDGVGTSEGWVSEPSQGLNLSGSHIPTFPTADKGACHTAAADLWFEWQERAAVREYVGGLARDLAEALTVSDLGECPRLSGDYSGIVAHETHS